MAQPYVGEIRMFGGNFAPAGWMFCEGQLLPISENETLFQLIGTTYGGDGESTFALPDLRGRIPIHMGTGPDGTTYQLGESGGTETVTLTTQQIPVHTHAPSAQSETGNKADPQGGVWAFSNLAQFTSAAPDDVMLPNLVNPTGGSQPHDNMMPFLCVNFIISLFGIFPSQT
ncbi:MAG TPA: tail fiber protein [Symbiobacteriaceae bacterium]|nr:tail fiber protein [Symbiobacteriaceae bacterium]